MDAHKIENFEGDTFPNFQTLSEDDCILIQKQIIKTFNLNNSISGLDLLRFLFDKSEIIPNINIEDTIVDLKKILTEINIFPMENIYIDWYRLDRIDKMRFDDFCKYLYDIWYPGPDDIEIFDNTFSWFVFITHYGVLRFVKKE